MSRWFHQINFILLFLTWLHQLAKKIVLEHWVWIISTSFDMLMFFILWLNNVHPRVKIWLKLILLRFKLPLNLLGCEFHIWSSELKLIINFNQFNQVLLCCLFFNRLLNHNFFMSAQRRTVSWPLLKHFVCLEHKVLLSVLMTLVQIDYICLEMLESVWSVIP